MNLPITKPNQYDLAWYIRECEALQNENASLREQLGQAAKDERALRRENVRLLEAVLNAPKAVREELDRRAARKEAQP